MSCATYGLVGLCARQAIEGEYCFDDDECHDDLFCDFVTGTCARGAALDAPCAYRDPDDPVPGTETIRCEAGLSCDPVNQVCVGYCVPGSECRWDHDCPTDYLCVLDRCRMPGAPGDDCEDDADCASEQCDFVTQTCVALLPNADPCGSHDECDSEFCDSSTFTCAPTVTAGAPCPSFDNAQCRDGYCDTTTVMPTCIAYVGPGGTCTSTVECDPDLDLSCADMTCVMQPFPNGTSCAVGVQCESSVCWMGVCDTGTPVGGECDSIGTFAECAVGLYCDIEDMMTEGTCAPVRRTGEECDNDIQCWGSCTARWGVEMCDETPAASLDECSPTAACTRPLPWPNSISCTTF